MLIFIRVFLMYGFIMYDIMKTSTFLCFLSVTIASAKLCVWKELQFDRRDTRLEA